MIGWVWNFVLFWQLISCYELSSCHKKVLTPEMDWEISNLTVCQKSIWLVEFEISPYYDSLSVVTSCQIVIKKFWLQKWIEGKTSSICLLSCILFDIMPSHVLWCYFKSCHAMRCNVMSYDIMWYHVMSCLVMSCDGMWSEVMSCHLMSWHVMTLDVMECKQKN